MSRPPRPTPPSAIDGFRRLERTRTIATPSRVVAGAAVVEPRPRSGARQTARRFAGALRLLGFVAVIATIIGTSVTLAQSTGSSSEPVREPAATSSSSSSSSSTSDSASSDSSAGDDAAVSSRDAASAKVTTSDTAEPVAVAETTEVPAPAATPRAATTTPTRALPLTGPVEVQWVLLGGALAVLAGMLAQIAGEPLPARARSNAR